MMCHREEPQGVEDARLSTDYGDVVIQGRRARLSSLDRLARARDDDCGLTHSALT
jgi:hypothetical protein